MNMNSPDRSNSVGPVRHNVFRLFRIPRDQRPRTDRASHERLYIYIICIHLERERERDRVCVVVCECVH